MNDSNILKQLQNNILVVLSEVIRVCEANGINYIAVGGTLLGAIRHKGFIPWDDDADIAMPREEYDKFVLLCRNGALSKGFTLQEYGKEEPNYGQSWIRVRMDNTLCVIDYHRLNGWKHLGVFVDVFPFERSYTNNMRIIVKTLKKYKKINRTLNNRIAFNLNTFKSKCFRIVTSFCSIDALFKKRLRVLTSLSKDSYKDKYIIDYNTPYGINKGVFDRIIFDNTIKVPFENIKIQIPKEYDYLLTLQFGDYMVLPPPNKRIGHLPEEILLK